MLKHAYRLSFHSVLAALCACSCGTPGKQLRAPAATSEKIAQIELCEPPLNAQDWEAVQKELLESGVTNSDEAAKALVLYARNGTELVRYEDAVYKTEIDLFKFAINRGWIGAALRGEAETQKQNNYVSNALTFENGFELLRKAATETPGSSAQMADRIVYRVLYSLSRKSYYEIGLKSDKEQAKINKIPGDAYIPLRNWVLQELQKEDLGALREESKKAWPEERTAGQSLKNWFRRRKNPTIYFGIEKMPEMPAEEKPASTLAAEPGYLTSGFKSLGHSDVQTLAQAEFLLGAYLMKLNLSQLRELLDYAKKRGSTSKVIPIAESRLAQFETIKKARETEDKLYYFLLPLKGLPKFERLPNSTEDALKNRATEYLRENIDRLTNEFWDKFRDSPEYLLLTEFPKEYKERLDKERSLAYDRKFTQERIAQAKEMIGVADKAASDFDGALKEGEKYLTGMKEQLEKLRAAQKAETKELSAVRGKEAPDFDDVLEGLADFAESMDRASKLDFHDQLNLKSHEDGNPYLGEVVAVAAFQRLFPPYGSRLNFEAFTRALGVAHKIMTKNAKVFSKEGFLKIIHTLREHARNLDLDFKQQDELRLLLREWPGGSVREGYKYHEDFRLEVDAAFDRAWGGRTQFTLEELNRQIGSTEKAIERYEKILATMKARRGGLDKFIEEQRNIIETNEKSAKDPK